MALVETGIWAKRERSILGETGAAQIGSPKQWKTSETFHGA